VPFLCELQSIRLKAKENLHDSIFICTHHRRFLSILRVIAFIGVLALSDVFEFNEQIQSFGNGLKSLNRNNFLDGFSNVEQGDVLSEFAHLYLGVV